MKNLVKMHFICTLGLCIVTAAGLFSCKDRDSSQQDPPSAPPAAAHTAISDESIKDALVELGYTLDQFRQNHSSYPESLESLYIDNSKPTVPKPLANIIYRASGLQSGMDQPGLILAYCPSEETAESYLVLFAGEQKTYFVEGQQVTPEAYKDACDELLMEYNPEYVQVFNDMLMLQTESGYKVLTDIISERVLVVNKAELDAASQSDNAIRKSMNLPELP